MDTVRRTEVGALNILPGRVRVRGDEAGERSNPLTW